tara:strand:+ start:38186 stop:39034 length:849 start_codon:yes stop_codon:yes gene_type:complete
LKIDLNRKGGKKIYVNDCFIRKQSDIKSYVRSVCFSSTDTNIIKGEPNYRRMWLDKVVTQLEPVYFELLSRFSKLLKQRSHFWRSNISKNDQHNSLIDSFDAQIAQVGTRILRRRIRALEKLKPHIQSWHNYLSKSKEKINLDYNSSIKIINNDDEAEITNTLTKELLNQRSLEELTGRCTIGPHRDDIEFSINDISVRKFGSAGQQRTITLALKMAELELVRNTIHMDPILILDDVLAELDIVRQSLLLDSVGNQTQCFISATHLNKFNNEFLESSQVIYL